MNCTKCGAQLPDGTMFCTSCGNPIQGETSAYPNPSMQINYSQPTPTGYTQQPSNTQQPYAQQQYTQQPMQQGFAQPQGGYQQPMMGGGMNAFINSLKADYMKLIGFIGAIIIMISPFFNWMSMKVKYDGDSEKETYNMFKIADDGDVGIYLLFALLLIVVGVGLIIWDLADYEPGRAQKSFDKQYLREWLETLDWDKTYPAPTLPEEVIKKTEAKYKECYSKLTGKELE